MKTESFGPIYNDDGTCSETTRAFAMECGKESECDKHDKWLASQTKWSGDPQGCDVCKGELVGGKAYDGATLYGPWALMCVKCHKAVGVGLGLGKGQEYTRFGKTWVKTGG